EELQRDNLRETIIWMRAKLLGDDTGLRRKPVRIHISGRDEWHEFDHYPPGIAAPRNWIIRGPGQLADAGAPGIGSAAYRYDPADPTPSVGGAIFAFTGAGAVDNAPLEQRPDVLTYTSAVLLSAMTVI